MVNSNRQLVRDALRAVRNVFDGLEGFTLREKLEGGAGDRGYGAILLASSAALRPIRPGRQQLEDASALKVTSAIQTFLDLKKLAGRGEEAAAAVYDRLLAGPLRAAADQNKGMRHHRLQSDHSALTDAQCDRAIETMKL